MVLLMSRVRALLVASAVIAGCSAEAVTRPPPPPVNWASLEVHQSAADAGATAATSKEHAATEAYLAALASPDFRGLGNVLDEDVHFTFAGFKDVHGRDNVMKAHRALLGGFESRRFVASRVLYTDAAQIVEWTMTGLQKQSTKPLSFKGVTLLSTKDDGSIVSIRFYFDEAVVNAQLGKGPKGLTAPAPPALPSGAPQELEQTRSPAEAANVAVFRAMLDTLENKDETAYLATMSDEVDSFSLEEDKPAHGKAEAAAQFKVMHKAIGELDTSIDNVWGIGPFVVAEYHIVGEQRGPLGFVPAQKNNLLKLFVVDVAEFQGNKIQRLWRYDNPAQLLVAP
jgi:ketosteroid isomerase-like protein